MVWILGLLGGWLVLAVALDMFGRRSPPVDDVFEAIVVLGCRVFPSGEPSTALRERVKLAVSLFESRRAPLLITTGGTGDSGFAEAEVAARIALELGVPRSAIHMESRSTSTQENARYCAMQVPARRVLLVTDAYHCVRARRVFARYFERVGTAGSVHPALRLRLKGALREVPVLVAYGLLRWL
ncbi:MAG: YdcF family protein [Nannocystaceae bacterium]|nr:YdcF family protein [Nannocystaceae bacterium]